MRDTAASPHLGLGALTGALVLLPFLVAAFPPATDLPQHVAQVHLLFEALSDPGTPYEIAWLAPNNLVYLVMAAFGSVLPPVAAGRATVGLIALAWVGAAFLAARVRGRAPVQAVVASLLVFAFPLYWGFLNFLVGWPIFLLWVLLTLDPPERGEAWRLALLAALLYGSHALWFAMGCLWLGVVTLWRRPGWGRVLRRGLALLPIVVAAALWYPTLQASREVGGFDVAAHWAPVWPLDRLMPRPVVEALLGGLRGVTEPVVAGALLLWIVAGVLTRGRDPERRIDRGLALASLPFFALFLFAPGKYLNTIYFAERWLAPGVILLLLATPPPGRISRGAVRSLGVALLAFFVLLTARTWHLFSTFELEGLRPSLTALPEGSHLLGLDLVKLSPTVDGRPYLQLFAWAQPLRDATLNFSFVEHASGIVRYREPPPTPWQPGLEWNAERVRREDVAHFDHVLIHGSGEQHRGAEADPQLEPVTPPAPWRLYRVRGGRPDDPAARE